MFQKTKTRSGNLNAHFFSGPLTIAHASPMMDDGAPTLRTLGDLFLKFAKDEQVSWDEVEGADEHVVMAGFACSLVAGRIAHRLMVVNGELSARVRDLEECNDEMRALEPLVARLTQYNDEVGVYGRGLEARLAEMETRVARVAQHNLEVTTECKGHAARVMHLEEELARARAELAREVALREAAEAGQAATALQLAVLRQEAADAARTCKNRVNAARSARNAAVDEATAIRTNMAQLKEQLQANVAKQTAEMLRMHAMCEAALRDAKLSRDAVASRAAGSDEARAAVVQQLIAMAERDAASVAWYRDKVMGDAKQAGLSRALLMAHQLLGQKDDAPLDMHELREGLIFMRDMILAVRSECAAFEITPIATAAPPPTWRLRALVELMATTLLDEDCSLLLHLKRIDEAMKACDTHVSVKLCVGELRESVHRLISCVRA